MKRANGVGKFKRLDHVNKNNKLDFGKGELDPLMSSGVVVFFSFNREKKKQSFLPLRVGGRGIMFSCCQDLLIDLNGAPGRFGPYKEGF